MGFSRKNQYPSVEDNGNPVWILKIPDDGKNFVGIPGSGIPEVSETIPEGYNF